MVRMIELQRRYDAAQRALKTHERAGEGLSEVLRG
jgi:flagellar basal body rod protein FlgG